MGYDPDIIRVDTFWNSYTAEINAGRPAVFLVDSDGNERTDHFITAVGYDTVQGVRRYAALNTWDKNLHWYDFGPLTDGKAWGIYGMTTLQINANPVPTLVILEPSGVLAASSGLTLTVHGTNYITTSRVLWKGIELATTYVNGTTLTAAVPAGLLASASVASVTVFNPAPLGGTSSSLSFSILNPVPVLTALSPGSVPAGTGDLLLTLTGQGFVPSSAARWNGAPLSTSYIDSTHLTALVPAANLRQPARAVISVSTPGPGGGESNSLDASVVVSLFMPVTLK